MSSDLSETSITEGEYSNENLDDYSKLERSNNYNLPENYESSDTTTDDEEYSDDDVIDDVIESEEDKEKLKKLLDKNNIVDKTTKDYKLPKIIDTPIDDLASEFIKEQIEDMDVIESDDENIPNITIGEGLIDMESIDYDRIQFLQSKNQLDSDEENELLDLVQNDEIIENKIIIDNMIELPSKEINKNNEVIEVEHITSIEKKIKKLLPTIKLKNEKLDNVFIKLEDFIYKLPYETDKYFIVRKSLTEAISSYFPEFPFSTCVSLSFCVLNHTKGMKYDEDTEYLIGLVMQKIQMG